MDIDGGRIETDELRFAAQAIREAASVVAMTGAGLSTPSGIPSFRGDGGVWKHHDPADFHLSRFEADPAGFWVDRLELHETMYGDREIDPNAAHEALADLESVGHLDSIITQNTDGLHREAGSGSVIKLHGSGEWVVCRDCGQCFDAEPVRERVRDGETPPRCSDCDGVLKPDVVLFGESLPEYALLKSHALAEQADVFLVAGSSLTVEPAASLPRTAADRGATMIVVDVESNPLSRCVEYDFRADATEALPRLRDAVVGGIE